MYMTVFEMNKKSILNAGRNTLNLTDGDAVHSWLTMVQDTTRADGQLLYKVLEKNNAFYLYVQSKTEFNPDTPEKIGLIKLKSFQMPDPKETVHFDLQVFPCKLNEQQKEIFIQDPTERLEWLKFQFSRFNIEVISCTEYKLSKACFKRDKIVRVPVASYFGTLKINDSVKAKELFEKGLGKLKNYGCGLILYK